MSNIVVGLTLRADGRGFVGEVRNARGELINLGTAGKGAAASLDDLGARASRSLAPLRSIQSYLAAIGAGFTLQQAVRSFAEYERGLVGVAKTADLTRDQVAELDATVTGMARRLPFARTELLSVAQAGGQLGVKGVQDLTLFAETIAKLGSASDLAGEEAATALTRVLNVTGESVDGIDELASVVVALGNNFAATEAEITRVATQVAQATAVFGISSEEAFGLAAAMRSIGVQAELGGSAVGRAFRAIEETVRTGGERLRELERLTGLTGDQLKQTFQEDAAGVFELFVAGVGEAIKAGDSAAEVFGRFGLAGEEILKVLPTLAQNSELLGRAMRTARDEAADATALNEEFLRSSTTLSAQLQLAANAIDESAALFGQALAPAIVSATEDLRAFVQASIDSGDAAEVFEAISDAVALLAENLDVVAALLAGRVGASLGATIGSFFGPLGTVIGGSAGALAAFAGTMLALGDDVDEATEAVDTFTAAQSKAERASDLGKAATGELADAYKRVASAALEAAAAQVQVLLAQRAAVTARLGDLRAGNAGVLPDTTGAQDAARNLAQIDVALRKIRETTKDPELAASIDRVVPGLIRLLRQDPAGGAWLNDLPKQIQAVKDAASAPAGGAGGSLPTTLRELIERLDPLARLTREQAEAESQLTAAQGLLTSSGHDLYELLGLLDHGFEAYVYQLGAAARAAREQARDVEHAAQVRMLEAEQTEEAHDEIIRLTAARELEKIELQRVQAIMSAQPGQIAAINAAYAELRAAVLRTRDADLKWSADQATALRSIQQRLTPVADKYREIERETRLLDEALDAGKITYEQYLDLIERLGLEVEAWAEAQDDAAESVRESARDMELSNQIRRLELENTSEARRKIIELTTARELERLELERTRELLAAMPEQYDEINAAYDRLRQAIIDKGAVDQLKRLRDEANPLLEIFKNTAEGVRKGFVDAFKSMFGGGKTGFRDMLDTWKDALVNTLAEMATLAIAQPVIVPVITAIGQGLGLGEAAIRGVTDNLGGSSGGFLGGNNPLSSIANLISGGPGDLATSIAMSSFGQSIGLSTTAATAGVIEGGIGGAFFSTTGGGSVLSGAGSALVAAAPYLAMAAVALPLLMGMFGGQPSVGPMGVADFAPGRGRGNEFDQPLIDPFTGDNGGDPEALKPIAEAIADLIADTADRFAATIDHTLRFRVARYDSPESGSGRMRGFEVNAFLRDQTEQRIAEGLTEEEALFEALKFAVTEAFTYSSATLTEIAANTTAETTEELLKHLEFGRHFDRLTGELARLGSGVNANTLAQAEATVALRERGEARAEEKIAPILEGLELALELFPASIEREISRDETVRGVIIPGGPEGDGGRFVEEGTDEFDRLTSGDGALPIIEQIRRVSETVSETAANYAENLERIRQVMAITAADVDQLIGTIAGTLDPAIVGPVTQLYTEQAAEIGALRPFLEDINEQIRDANAAFPELGQELLDVNGIITQALADLDEQRRQMVLDNLQGIENNARGRGAINGLDGLIDSRDAMLQDASDAGVDVADRIIDVFGEQVRRQLSGLDLEGLQAALEQTTDTVARSVIQSMISEAQAVQQEAQLIERRNALAAAYEREASALEGLRDRMLAFARSIRDVRLSLLRGELAKGGPEARYLAAREQFDDVFARAQVGDEDALANLGDIARSFLEASRAFNSDEDIYNADFDLTIDRLEAVESVASRQARVAEEQLAALKEQVSQFITLNDSVLSIADAIRDLQNVMTPADRAELAGYSFGTNVATNKYIYNKLVEAGLPTPAGFGVASGNLGQLRAADPRVHEFLVSLGYDQGGWVPSNTLARIHNDELIYTGPAAHVFNAKESLALLQMRAANDTIPPDFGPVIAAIGGTTTAIAYAGETQADMSAVMIDRMAQIELTISSQAQEIRHLTQLLKRWGT